MRGVKEIRERAERAIAERVFPGCSIGVLNEETKQIICAGRHTYEENSPEVTEESVYDLASITKSIPTASSVLLLTAEGTISLQDPVTKFLPELQNDYGATIEDLLRYRVSGPRMSVLPHRTFEQIRTHMLETGFSGPPGERNYTNAPAYLLGIILERVTGSSLEALGFRNFFGPLAMEHTTYFPAKSLCVPTEIQGGEITQGIPHDESARVFSRARRSTGHAGLFSTAADLLLFMEALLRGEYPEVLQGAEDGLGWEANHPWFMGKHSHAKMFGKTGFTGTSIAADKAKNTALVILSNRTFPARPMDSEAINDFRADVADMVF